MSNVTSSSVGDNLTGMPVAIFRAVHALRIPSMVAALPTLGAGPKLLFGLLWVNTAQGTRRCRRSLKMLADDLGVSPPTVTEWWKHLEAEGLVRGVMRTGTGKWSSKATDVVVEHPLVAGSSWAVYVPMHVIGLVSARTALVAGALFNVCGDAGWSRRTHQGIGEMVGVSARVANDGLRELVNAGFALILEPSRGRGDGVLVTFAFHPRIVEFLRPGALVQRLDPNAPWLGPISDSIASSVGSDDQSKPELGVPLNAQISEFEQVDHPRRESLTVPVETAPEEIRPRMARTRAQDINHLDEEKNGDGDVDDPGVDVGTGTRIETPDFVNHGEFSAAASSAFSMASPASMGSSVRSWIASVTGRVARFFEVGRPGVEAARPVHGSLPVSPEAAAGLEAAALGLAAERWPGAALTGADRKAVRWLLGNFGEEGAATVVGMLAGLWPMVEKSAGVGRPFSVGVLLARPWLAAQLLAYGSLRDAALRLDGVLTAGISAADAAAYSRVREAARAVAAPLFEPMVAGAVRRVDEALELAPRSLPVARPSGKRRKDYVSCAKARLDAGEWNAEVAANDPVDGWGDVFD